MNHHRVGISSVILLAVISIIYFHEVTIRPLPLVSPLEEVKFAGTVPTPLTHGDVSKKQIIFTFDGGEGSQSISAILDVLAKHNTRGTFFLTGKWVLRNPDAVRRMHAEGHEIYNHSLSHPHLPLLEDQDIVRELASMDQSLLNLIGSSTRPYFRPPYGDHDSRVLQVAARNGYRAVMWTVDAGDWMESEGFTDGETRARIFSHIEPGAIILMHIGDNITGRILDDVFTNIKQQGYSLVSLSQGVE